MSVSNRSNLSQCFRRPVQLLFAAALAACAGQGQECPALGNLPVKAYVTRMEGEWFLQMPDANAASTKKKKDGGSQPLLAPLRKGCSLPPGAIVLPAKARKKESKIFITYSDTGKPEEKICDLTSACPVVLKEGLTSPPRLATEVWKAIMEEFRRAPARYENAVTHLSGHSIRDGVLIIENELIDLSGICTGISHGDYRIQFSDLNSGQTPWNSAFTWDGNHAPLKSPKLKPGLYDIQVTGADLPMEAWVLIASPGPAANRVREQRSRMEEMTADWPKEAPKMGDEASRVLLRAQLGAAAKQL